MNLIKILWKEITRLREIIRDNGLDDSDYTCDSCKHLDDSDYTCDSCKHYTAMHGCTLPEWAWLECTRSTTGYIHWERDR
jgi:hypothetical protein